MALGRTPHRQPVSVREAGGRGQEGGEIWLETAGMGDGDGFAREQQLREAFQPGRAMCDEGGGSQPALPDMQSRQNWDTRGRNGAERSFP